MALPGNRKHGEQFMNIREKIKEESTVLGEEI